jgi:hypothetical protein
MDNFVGTEKRVIVYGTDKKKREVTIKSHKHTSYIGRCNRGEIYYLLELNNEKSQPKLSFNGWVNKKDVDWFRDLIGDQD